MRSFFLTSIAVAGLATAALGHAGGARKSLSFGPVHPQAGLRTMGSAAMQAFTVDESADPMQVAREFVRGLARDTAGDFVIRDDSYTDKATGVTHVYVRQLVNGIEVADGDINVNVKDGVILSFGDSVCDMCWRSCDLC
jgi:extracellular elastinolytic metalloproteinase